MLKQIQVQDVIDKVVRHIVACGPQEEERIVSEINRRVLVEFLELQDWNQMNTAERLGIHRNTLERAMVNLGIPRAQDRSRRKRV